MKKVGKQLLREMRTDLKTIREADLAAYDRLARKHSAALADLFVDKGHGDYSRIAEDFDAAIGKWMAAHGVRLER
jgi:hypothetical protein